jgi:hypothetical protein
MLITLSTSRRSQQWKPNLNAFLKSMLQLISWALSNGFWVHTSNGWSCLNSSRSTSARQDLHLILSRKTTPIFAMSHQMQLPIPPVYLSMLALDRTRTRNCPHSSNASKSIRASLDQLVGLHRVRDLILLRHTPSCQLTSTNLLEAISALLYTSYTTSI